MVASITTLPAARPTVTYATATSKSWATLVRRLLNAEARTSFALPDIVRLRRVPDSIVPPGRRGGGGGNGGGAVGGDGGGEGGGGNGDGGGGMIIVLEAQRMKPPFTMEWSECHVMVAPMAI